MRIYLKRKTKQISIYGFLLLVTLYFINSFDTGYADIVDGDSLHLNMHKIRLYGIDAVEKHQKCKSDEGEEWNCGLEAKKHLESLIENKRVICWKLDKDRYMRDVSICYNSDLKSLNAELVKAGYAIAYTRYSSLYLNEEREARINKQGIWRGKFMIPEKYRLKKRVK